MKTQILLSGLAVGLIALADSSFGQSWQTVDDFQYAGQLAVNYGLTLAPGGTLYGAGIGLGTSGYHGLLRTSVDGGSTWSLLDDFLYSGLNYTVYAGIVADAVGNLYVAGSAYDDGSSTGGPTHWIVRRSTDGGATWSIVDDFVPGGTETQPNGLTVDVAGNVYVAGNGDYNASGQYWTVRKGIGGTNFFNVDNFPDGSLYTALTIFAHPSAGIFAAGEGPIATNKFGGVTSGWLVRRSINGGTNWTTVDSFILASGYRANPFGFGTDTNGNLYVVGRAANKYKGSGFFHWLVRKSVNGGTSWSTDDDYQMYITGTQGALAMITDAKGNLYVVGGAGPNWWAGDTDWIVRKKAAGASSWTNADDFKFGGYAGARSATTNSQGHVLVGGSGSNGSADHWLVRRN